MGGLRLLKSSGVIEDCSIDLRADLISPSSSSARGEEEEESELLHTGVDISDLHLFVTIQFLRSFK